MTTTYQDYASESTVISTELNSLANATGASSTSEVNNTTNRYLGGEFDVYLAAAAANAGYVNIYLIEGTSTGNLATTAQIQNARPIGRVQLNGTTAVRKNLKIDGISPFWKVYVYNGSGGALASSGNVIKFTGLRFTDT